MRNYPPQEVNEEYVEEARTAAEYRDQKAHDKYYTDTKNSLRNDHRYTDKTITAVKNNFDAYRGSDELNRLAAKLHKAERRQDLKGAKDVYDKAVKVAKKNENAKKADLGHLTASTAAKKRGYYTGDKYNAAADAIARHNRRHPDRKLEGVQNLREFYNDDFDDYMND